MFKHNLSAMTPETQAEYKARIAQNIATWGDYSMIHVTDSGYVKTWVNTI